MATFTPPSSSHDRALRRLRGGKRQRSSKKSSFTTSRFLPPSRHLPIQPSRFRLILVWGILLLGLVGLALNLLRLQVVQAPWLKEQAQQQQIVSLRPFVPRRPIVDRLGNVLAIDQPTYTLYAHPMLFKQPREAIAAALSPILGRSSTILVRQFNKHDSGVQLDYALPENVANQVSDLKLDGLELVEHPQRLYPQQDLFADVVGYVDVDRKGQAGVEFSQQRRLERPIQTIQIRRTGDGSLIPDSIPDGFLHQDDLRLELSLDSRLQRVTRFALKQQMQAFNALRGTVLVMDARNGEMLAMVSEPSYDPNTYFNFNVERFRNWAISDLFEPGSTFKPINVAIALEAKAIRSNEVFNDEGQLQFGEWTIQNYDYTERGGRGPQTVSDIVKHSSNVGMVHIVQRLEAEAYYQWLERLGLGKPTGIDLPFEAASQMKSREQFLGAAVERATTAFGQGFSLTPIQLLQLHGTLANGGKLVTPHIVRRMAHADGSTGSPLSQPKPRQVFSNQTTSAVLSMMEEVVKDGTGEVAQIEGYRIAGKTGTAQKASPGGGYSNTRITSFVSIFPVDAPRYVVLVVIDEPQGDDAYGSTVSAPIAKSVMEAMISLERIPPNQSFTGNEDFGG